jgi:hypothetical protein
MPQGQQLSENLGESLAQLVEHFLFRVPLPISNEVHLLSFGVTPCSQRRHFPLERDSFAVVLLDFRGNRIK